MYNDKNFEKPDYVALRKSIQERFLQADPDNILPNDFTEGSIIGTVMESFAHELALAYEQMDRMYDMGYVETAEGRALDKLAQLTGLDRVQPGRLSGMITFGVKAVQKDDIVIPMGTTVTGKGDAIPLFETTEEVTLVAGSVLIQVPILSLEPTEVTIDPETLIFQPRPVKGIDSVNNVLAISSKVAKENDGDFRDRIKKSSTSAQSGTTASIESVVRALGYTGVKVQEKHSTLRGIVTINISDESLLKSETKEKDLQKIESALEEIRPAGIQYRFEVAPSIHIRLSAQLILTEKVDESVMDSLRQTIIVSIKKYFSDLSAGTPLKWQKLKNILTTPDLVNEVMGIPADAETRRPYLELVTPDEVEGIPEDLSSRVKEVNGEPDKVFVLENERIILEGEPQILLRLPDSEVYLTVYLNGVGSVTESDVESKFKNVVFAEQDAVNRSYSYEILVEKITELIPPTESIDIAPVFEFKNATTGRITDLKADGEVIMIEACELIKMDSVKQDAKP